MLVLQAMAGMEGFYEANPNVRPRRNNNPLDLIWCPESKAFGATHGDPDFAVFPDLATGWKAGARWLSVPAEFDKKTGKLVAGYLGATFSQFISRFAPPNQNNTSAYIAEVCAKTGFSPTTVLTAEMLQLPAAA